MHTIKPNHIPNDEQIPSHSATTRQKASLMKEEDISRSLEPSSEFNSPFTQSNNPIFDPLAAINKSPYYVLPYPIDQLPMDIQKAIQAVQSQIKNPLNNNNVYNYTQGAGQQQSSGGNQQPSTSPSQGSQGQTDPSNQGQGQTDPSNQGMVGYIPIVFFPGNGCNGGNGGQNQYGMGMPYPYQQQQQQQQPQQQQSSQQNACNQCPGNQRSHPLFGAISNARIFHNSDFNSVTQVFPRPVRSRKAKIDRKIIGALAQD